MAEGLQVKNLDRKMETSDLRYLEVVFLLWARTLI